MAQTSTIHLLTGDWADRLNSLYAAFHQALKDEESGKAPELLASETAPSELLAAEYNAAKEQAEAEGIRVELTAVGRKRWRELKAAHPARTEGDEETVKADRLAGVNVDSIEDDLVYATLSHPEFSTRAQFDEWADGLSEGEWQTLVTRAWQLANVAASDPKSLPSWRTPSSAESSM